MSVCRVPYTGDVPGADTNDYVLVSSFGIMTPAVKHVTDLMCVERCRVSLAHSDDGAFRLERSEDGSTWELLNTAAITAESGERAFYDAAVSGLPFWRIVWENGGSAQTVWAPDIVLTPDIAAAG